MAVALIVFRLLHRNAYSEAKQITKNAVAVLFMSYFLVHLIGTFYSSNLSYAFFDLQIKLPFLLFPLLLMTPLQRPSAPSVLKFFFIAGCSIAAMWCFLAAVISYFEIHNPSNFFYSPYSRFMHVTYFSMYMNLCILFLIDDLTVIFRKFLNKTSYTERKTKDSAIYYQG